MSSSQSGSSAPPGDGLPAHRILVIDDEPLIGTMVARILRSCIVTIELCALGALQRLDDGETFDRILCDIVMPKMNGREFFEQVEKRHPHVIVILVFMTGGAPCDGDREWMSRMPCPLLRKPFDPQELVQLLCGPPRASIPP